VERRAEPEAAGAEGREQGPPPTALEVLRAYLAAQSSAFLGQLPRLREGKPEASHRIRVACRRSRSMLRTYRSLLDPDWCDELAEQIAEFTDVIAPERDVEVVRERLLKSLDAMGEESGPGAGALGPAGAGSVGAGVLRARTLLDRMLQREYAAAHEATLAALAGPKFHALADRLALAPQTLPAGERAAEPAHDVLYPLVSQSFALVERRVAGLPDPRKQNPRSALADEATDELWHRLRIAAKRARYAAEVCVPVAGPPASEFAGRMTLITEDLGVQQDAAVASAVLMRAARTPRIAAPTGFVLGQLLGNARAGILRARLAFPGLWTDAADPAHRTWLER
jgi:CHAD domain-containing protein